MLLLGYIYEDYHDARSLEHKVLFAKLGFPGLQVIQFTKISALYMKKECCEMYVMFHFSLWTPVGFTG